MIDNDISEIPLDGQATTFWLADQKSGRRKADKKLDDRQPWIELDLGSPQPVESVRIFNTAFLGRHNRAAVECKVLLLDADRKVLSELNGTFGRTYPGNNTSRKGAKTIPLGDGPLELSLRTAVAARYLRVLVPIWFGQGAGLNELQVYGPAK